MAHVAARLLAIGKRVVYQLRAPSLPDRFVVPYLSFWARFVLSVRKPFIIGVTGSVGKSTTTNMIAAVLMHPDVKPVVGAVGKASENMNDDAGLPLAVLRLGWLNRGRLHALLHLASLPFRALALATIVPYPRVLVLEYGTHWNGHLHNLVKVAPPNLGVVTTIGPAHLDRLKTLEGVAYEKSAIVRAVGPSGLVVLGDGHDYVNYLEQATRAPVVKVSGRGKALAENITRVVCRWFKIPDPLIESVLSTFQLPEQRLTRIELDSITVIDDSVNANPMSMQLGLDTLAEEARAGQRRVAILGMMAELGEATQRYHEETGKHARRRADFVVGVGELAKHFAPDRWYANSAQCAEDLAAFIRQGDLILVKGSGSTRMGVVVRQLHKTAHDLQRDDIHETALPRAREM